MLKTRGLLPMAVAALLVVGMMLLPACQQQVKDDGDVNSTVTESSATSETTSQTTSQTSQPAASDLDTKVKAKLDSMTTEQKVAQLFVITPEALTGVERATRAGNTTKNALQSYPVGGLVYFKGNLENSDQTTQMLANTQTYSEDITGLPIFLGVDEEGGTVSRIGGTDGFGVSNVGNMRDIGDTGDVQKAHDVAVTISDYLKPLGFNLDFAPVAAIANSSSFMYERSFGSTADVVTSMVDAQVKGFTESGMLCCVKHFPGLGDVSVNTDDGVATSDFTLDQLKASEFLPFETAISDNVPFVMVGHLLTPNATSDGLPASLSYEMVTGQLRQNLGYDGIVITDSLSAAAVKDIYSDDRIGVEAIKAGDDMLLMPENFQAAYQGIIDAVNSGEISQDRLDESVTRILRVKMQME